MVAVCERYISGIYTAYLLLHRYIYGMFLRGLKIKYDLIILNALKQQY